MKIGVIGAGRLGICFALLCEQAGYDVLVSDIREDYVADLMEKKIKTNEPDVQEFLSRSLNFSATTSNEKVIQECDIIYTLVATPSLPSGDYDVSLWTATNEQGRDFRLWEEGELWSQSKIQKSDNNRYIIDLGKEILGYKAIMVEFVIDPDSDFPLTISTGPYVIPETYPYEKYQVKN